MTKCGKNERVEIISSSTDKVILKMFYNVRKIYP